MRLRVVADHVRSVADAHRRRRDPGQRGPRLRAAPAAAPRRPLDAPARRRRPVPARAAAGLAGRDEAVLPRARDRLRPHLARSRTPRRRRSCAPSPPGTTILDTAVARTKQAGGTHAARATRRSCCTTPTASRSTSPSRWPPEQGLQVDREGFTRLMTEQRAARQGRREGEEVGHADTEVYRDLRALGETDFTGYTELDAARPPCVGLVVDGEPVGRDRAGPARPRSCSTARRSTPSPAARSPTRASSPPTACSSRSSTCSARSRAWSRTPSRWSAGELRAGRRRARARSTRSGGSSARQAHSGTHVVHAALRQVLGPTALQSGSYNKPGYLRLDFAWGQALSPATRSEIEEVANHAVRQDLPVSATYMPLPRGPGDRRDGAVRRDLRRGRARRRDRRPVVARAVRWHPRAALRADRRRSP